jgi:hypothetical protein
MSVRCLVHNELDAVISRVRNVAKLAPKGDEIQTSPKRAQSSMNSSERLVKCGADPASPLYFPPIAAPPSDASEMASMPPLIQGCGPRSCS